MFQIKHIKSRTGRGKIKLTKAMEELVIPGFNQGSVVIVGAVKTGKSNLVVNLMTRPEFYKGYFDKENIWLFSPTATYDEMAEEMEIEEENRISEDMINKLTELIEEQTTEVEDKGKARARKLCLIFDDLSSCKKLQRSKTFEKIFTTNRHLNIMLICCVHKISALTRLCRLQCSHIIFFSAPFSECEIVSNEFCGQGLTKREMLELIKYATTPDEKSSHPFLYINLIAKPLERYRKNFTRILRIKQF